MNALAPRDPPRRVSDHEEAIDAWHPERLGARGGQRRYSDEAIQAALTLRLLFRLPLRQTEGFLRSLVALIGLDLDVPDHTTLSRRTRDLELPSKRPASRSLERNARVRRVRTVGRSDWKRESGYHQHGTVENAVSRYKTIVGPTLRARDEQGRRVEAFLGCLMLDRMREPAWPDSAAISV
jgi:hypothetical protein